MTRGGASWLKRTSIESGQAEYQHNRDFKPAWRRSLWIHGKYYKQGNAFFERHEGREMFLPGNTHPDLTAFPGPEYAD